MKIRCLCLLAAFILNIRGVNAQALQSMIDTCSPGGTVIVPAGMWNGDVVLRTRLTLRGEAGAIVRGSGSGSCITILADSCIVEGLTIEHSGPMLVHEDAGILLRSDGNRIRNNALRDVLFGVYLYRSDGNEIAWNTVEGRQELDQGQRGSGVHVWDSRHNRLIGNTIRHARDGLYIQNASHTWIQGNEVSDLRYGLHYMYADSNTFIDNRFHDNIAGAAIMYSHGIVMKHNEFRRNRGFASYGILFQDCHGMIADSNIIADNVTGMFFEASTNNRFLRNIVAQNDVAIQIFQNSTGNVFSENAFIDNLTPLSVVGRRTGTQWSEGGRGNYWSGNDGYDLDGDGIGDEPVTIQSVFDYLEGLQPALRLYLSSPASQALAAATRAFPILALSEERDTAPLMQPVARRGSAFHAGDRAGTRTSHAMVVTILLAFPAVGVVFAVVRRSRRP
jgi:nitrous oxidase accessory protein